MVQLEGKGGDSAPSLGNPDIPEEAPPELVEAISTRLGMPEGWYARAKLMKPTRAPLLVWSRPDPAFRLRTDQRGVWQGDKLVADWGSVFGVVARKRYEQDRPDGALWIELEPANAPRQSLQDSLPEFGDVVEAMSARLPGMQPGWFAEVERLQPGKVVTVWRRAWPDGYPRLHADDRGVWRADMPGQPFGVEWDDIGRVLGREAEGTTPYLEIDLEREGVNHLYLRSDMPGFTEVVEAITTRLPHMPQGWLEKIARLRPGYALWRRDFVIAGERLDAEGMLITTWRRLES